MKRTDLDLASRALGGSVRVVSDEFFAPRESLIQSWAPGHDKLEFGPHGKIYDGWETRRRRTPGYDWAVVALGVPGVLHEIVVDTAWFTGNYPPEISVEATWLDGSPSDAELAAAEWVTVVPHSAARGNTANTYRVHNHWAFSHVRLNIYPDGGVARLRVHGTAVPDPRVLGSRIDLAALHNGGDIAECSDMFYSDARQVLYPGVARSMSEGWETARRRTTGNDYLVVTLAGPSRLSYVDIDTGCFLGNAPGRVQLSGRTDDEAPWEIILPESTISPDAHNRFRLDSAGAPGKRWSAVRVDVFPDGGFSRLHLMGELAEESLAEAIANWLRLLPSAAYGRILAGMGIERVPVRELTAAQLVGFAW
ncbi:allantoicase [Nakamurella sp. PAMC28650]|jgi:allantoicase|uniref:allantoicase n=1 Tax=Nakamurella sp. PAMC28650 TaxID=2762325 RepID=UPI00164EB9BD|nr:allantoicase [Nakamurella sp. PAMC28650]QNK81657.1 allantoicase [Nakamurella sp. PAMC28650]